MKPGKLLLILALASALLWASSSSAAIRKTGINSAAFLKIGVGARMVALGSAATTIEHDANMIFWNPAGIDMEGGKVQATFTHNNWIFGMSHEAGAVTYSVPGIGTFGVGMIYLGLSDIPADRDIAPKGFEEYQTDMKTGDSYDYSDMAVMVSYARRFTDRFVMAGTLKFINSSIDGETASAYAVDFGVIYWTGFRDLRIGARINNLGSDLKFFDIAAPIPLCFSIGTSMSLVREGPNAFTTFIDFTKPQDTRQLVFSGIEYKLKDVLSVRGGYKFNYSGIRDRRGYKLTDEGYSAGIGLIVPTPWVNLRLDYAFTNFEIFDNVHRFTVTLEK